MELFTDFPIRLVDVSQFNDNHETDYKPNFDKLIAIGFMGAGIRVGYGVVEDWAFRSYWTFAKGKIQRLPYWYFDFYSHKGTGMSIEAWAIIQANECWDLLKDDPGELPLHIDCEASSFAKITYANGGEYARGVKAFMVEYQRLSGGKVSMYFSPGLFWVFGDWFKDADLWIAWYNKSIKFQDILNKLSLNKWRGKVRLWQYASDGDINNDGIADGLTVGMESKFLDLNVFLGTLQEWSAWAGTTPAVVTPPGEDEVVPIPQPNPNEHTKIVWLMKVNSVDGLNIRNKPKNYYGSYVYADNGWIANGKQVEVIETVVIGADSWARIGQNQYCAIRYNGTEFLKS